MKKLYIGTTWRYARYSTTQPTRQGYLIQHSDSKLVSHHPMTSFHHLPTEILCHILSRFDTADILGGCMLVSKTWHTRLVQCAPLWIHVKSGKEQFSPKALLPMAHHIQKLDILDHHHSWLQLLFDDIKQGVFTNLKHLKLNLRKTCQISFFLLNTTDGYIHIIESF